MEKIKGDKAKEINGKGVNLGTLNNNELYAVFGGGSWQIRMIDEKPLLVYVEK